VAKGETVSVTRELADPPAGGARGFGPYVRVNPGGVPEVVNDTGDVKLPEDTTVTAADAYELGATRTLV